MRRLCDACVPNFLWFFANEIIIIVYLHCWSGTGIQLSIFRIIITDLYISNSNVIRLEFVHKISSYFHICEWINSFAIRIRIKTMHIADWMHAMKITIKICSRKHIPRTWWNRTQDTNRTLCIHCLRSSCSIDDRKLFAVCRRCVKHLTFIDSIEFESIKSSKY